MTKTAYPAADTRLQLVEQVTGTKPDTCPWQAYTDPVVVDILEAYRFMESGQLALWWGDNPPSHLVEGIAFYHSALNRCKAWQREQEDLRSAQRKT